MLCPVGGIKMTSTLKPRFSWTYRKVINRGFRPCWFHGDYGSVVAWIEKRGRKWMYVRFATGERKRMPLSQERYFTPFKSKRG